MFLMQQFFFQPTESPMGCAFSNVCIFIRAKRSQQGYAQVRLYFLRTPLTTAPISNWCSEPFNYRFILQWVQITNFFCFTPVFYVTLDASIGVKACITPEISVPDRSLTANLCYRSSRSPNASPYCVYAAVQPIQLKRRRYWHVNKTTWKQMKEGVFFFVHCECINTMWIDHMACFFSCFIKATWLFVISAYKRILAVQDALGTHFLLDISCLVFVKR